jgi:hypothetical protein
MRLLKRDDDGELSLIQFVGEEIPEYAILSHTWGADDDEATFEDLMNGTGKDKPGYAKIRLCAEQADLDGLKYSWVDTCCIAKSSSRELEEAINSMYTWYSEAKVCYAYLSDVESSTGDGSEELLEACRNDFPKESRWFTRGWTLQELLAPKRVIFFDSSWRKIGEKMTCCNAISSITGINKAFLLDPSKISEELYSTVMFWAAKRQTSRPEDIAYCLMGIFGVHMSLYYGEGEPEAFRRLQLELFKVESCQSLLTWGGLSKSHINSQGSQSSIFPSPLTFRPILARSPSLFSKCPVWHRLHTRNDAKPWIVTNCGIELQVRIITSKTWFVTIGPDSTGVQKRYDLAIAVLPFRTSEKAGRYIGMLLSGNSSEDTYTRVSSHEGYVTVKVPTRMAVLAESKRICLSDRPVYGESRHSIPGSKFVVIESRGFHLRRVLGNGCEWDEQEQCLVLQESQEALLRFVDEKHSESAFHLLVSDYWPPICLLDDCQFPGLGIAIVQNDYAANLFRNPLELSQHSLRADKQRVVVKMGDTEVVASLDRKKVYTDTIRVLKIEILFDPLAR